MTSETGCGCAGACAPSLTLDPHKRVHYTQGQVLGVDEFIQEEFYFLEGARRHHRTLHGYGTVCGLGVSASNQDGGIEVRVEPGHAIDTHGRELRVGAAQCARLDTWLANQATASPPLSAPSPAVLGVWVVLCYRECRTDLEPIPGGPCRTADESMTPTRVTETFSIRFDLERPDMTRLDAIRAFAALVGRLDPTPGGAATITPEEFAEAVVALAEEEPDMSPPLVASPPILTSPPDGPIEVPAEDMRLYLTAAFNAWVTRVRPKLMSEGTGCADAPDGDGCIALGQLQVPILDADGTLTIDGDASVVVVDDAERPLLMSTQVLQELLIPASGGTGTGVSEHAALTGLDADDHAQYLLIDPRTGAGDDRLINTLSGENAFTLRNVPSATAIGEVMPWGQAAGGDLSGSYPDPQVIGLRGLPVPEPAVADDGRHLSVRNDGGTLSWELVDPPTPETGETDHGALSGLADDDHSQYLLIEPRTGGGDDMLVNTLSGDGNFTLRDVPDATGPGEVMPWGQGAAGDLDGQYPAPRVIGLQGLSVPIPSASDDGRHLSIRNSGGNLAWELVDPPEPTNTAGGEPDLVRLMALSWVHNAASNLEITLDGAVRHGVAVAFGTKEIGDSRVVLGRSPDLQRNDLGSLDIHSFRVFADIPDDSLGLPDITRRIRINPIDLLPISPDISEGESFFDSATVLPDNLAPGACLVFGDSVISFLMDLKPVLWIELDGDHVMAFREDEERARAVDTEFLRSRLPAGDRPEGTDLGTQGGPFSSWINRPDPRGLSERGGIDVNTVDIGGLVALGLTRPAARMVINARRARDGAFASIEDVLGINNLSGAAQSILSDDSRVYVLPR